VQIINDYIFVSSSYDSSIQELSDVLITRDEFLGYGRIVDFCRTHAKWSRFYPNGERPTMIAGWDAVLQEYGNDINAVDQYVGMQMEEHVPGKLFTTNSLDEINN
jgi:hypothetical protein